MDRNYSSATAATNHAMDKSPLSKLPAELRNRLYELSLTHDKPYVILGSDDFPRRCTVPKTKASFGLTATCKAIRAETILLFYSLNEFVFLRGGEGVVIRGIHPWDRKAARPWDGSIHAFQCFAWSIGDESAAALRSVRIDLCGTHSLASPYGRDTIAGAMRAIVSETKQLKQCTFRIAGDMAGLGDEVAFELGPGDMARSLEHLRTYFIKKRDVSNFQSVAELLDGLDKLETKLDEVL